MKTANTVLVGLLLLLPTILLPVPSTSAQDAVYEKIGEFGYIDWLNQMVYAKGVGLPPQDKQNSTQARLLAVRAAQVVAQRNLLEVIKGVHIDSTTVVEKRVMTDERIVSQIKGAVQFCRLEDTRYLKDDAVEVIVSMPLVGRLGEILVETLEGRIDRTLAAPGGYAVEERLVRLENRVLLLEQQILRLQDVAAEQDRLLLMFKALIHAWQRQAEQRSVFTVAAYASETELAAMRNEFLEQEKRLAAYGVHLNDLTRRLAALEQKLAAAPAPRTTEQKGSYPYTGLVVDARGIGFKPCLKPEIYSGAARLYPGDYLDLNRTIKMGYVRYYHDLRQAQQSDRVGSLPYVVEAVGTPRGDRSLLLPPENAAVLKTILKNPNNFLADGRVVVVF